MKKILAALTIVAMLLITSSAMAKGVKAPKTLCIDYDQWSPWVQQLSFKAIGTVYIQGNKVKTYAISGISEEGPLTGTAYVLPGTTILRASYSTTYTGLGWDYPVDAGFNLVFDLATGTGTADLRYANPPDNDLNTDYGLPVSSTDCEEASMIFDAPAMNAGPAAQKQH
jgi:hypothetical protein